MTPRLANNTGARIVGGSDWSVLSVNPLDAIETALRRQDPDSLVEGTLNAEQAVTLDTMLAAYTRNAAWLMHQDDIVGSVEVGKRADLVLLDRDLFQQPHQRAATQVRGYLQPVRQHDAQTLARRLDGLEAVVEMDIAAAQVGVAPHRFEGAQAVQGKATIQWHSGNFY